MKIRNREAEALPSSITPRQLGQALGSIDFNAIPPHKRKAALMDALATIMGETIHSERARNEIKASQILHRRRHGAS